jgi:hypothetical protein
MKISDEERAKRLKQHEELVKLDEFRKLQFQAMAAFANPETATYLADLENEKIKEKKRKGLI